MDSPDRLAASDRLAISPQDSISADSSPYVVIRIFRSETPSHPRAIAANPRQSEREELSSYPSGGDKSHNSMESKQLTKQIHPIKETEDRAGEAKERPENPEIQWHIYTRAKEQGNANDGQKGEK